MSLSCPICRKKTEVDQDVGDFLSRCDHCGNLLRFPPVARARREQPPPRTRSASAVGTAEPPKVDTPELQRIRVRHAAVARALRKGNQEAMGTLGWIGLGVVVVLAVILVSSRAQRLINQGTASSDTLVMR